jgi:23S rRNA (guanine2445-N2)-methyltransferase / 23S rRNA (guanine2069-N7)-methyltransferase
VGSLRAVATATSGLESVVARELDALGYPNRADRPGWRAFEGDASAIARANLFLRASDRVLLELGAFPAADFDALFEGILAIPWEEYLPKNARFPVRGRSVKSALASVPACQSVAKKAIVERLRRRHGVETLPEDGALFPVEVALLRDEAKLLLDTSGAGLHKRGYRPESGASPLKETLAAGLVLLSFWNRERPFLDPFCGTGTIAIEAALLGRNRAPGLGRSFASESWDLLAGGVFDRAREEAKDVELQPFAEPLAGFDRDPSAIASARKSARAASLDEDVRFERRDFGGIDSDRLYGCLVTNPPYGERMGDAEEMRALYRSMPGIFRRLPTWSFFVLTARRDLERDLGQSADRRRKLYNGDIECTYFQFFGPRPDDAGSSRRAFGGLDEKALRQAEIFGNRLKKRARHLRKWPSKRGIDCFRLYDRDVKEVPLVVERFGDGVLLTETSRKLESRTRAEHEDWLDLMARTAAEALEVPEANVYVAGRSRPPRTFRVNENGFVFEAELPGPPRFEPSLRAVRTWLRERARGKSVLVTEETLAMAAEQGGARSTARLGPGTRGQFELAVLEVPLPESFPERIAPGGAVLVLARDPRAKLPPDASRHWTVEEITERTIPEEFRGKPHRVWLLTRP